MVDAGVSYGGGLCSVQRLQTSRIGFAVHFVDVGQGDGAIVVCDGKTLVIDGGTAENGAKMVEYLQNTLHVSKVDFVIGTHPHGGSYRRSAGCDPRLQG